METCLPSESIRRVAVEVTHDLNNALAVILNYSTSIKAETARAAQADADRWGTVSQEAEHVELAALIAARAAARLQAAVELSGGDGAVEMRVGTGARDE